MIENTGADIYVTFDANDRQVTARLKASTPVTIGEPLGLSVEVDSLCLFDPRTQSLLPR